MKRLGLIIFAMGASLVASAETTPQLSGSEWGTENGMGQFIQFKEDGGVYGFAGCNSFIGSYEQKNETISIKDFVVTKKICEDWKVVEEPFLHGLENARTIKMVDGDIRFYNADGKWILGLRQIR